MGDSGMLQAETAKDDRLSICDTCSGPTRGRTPTQRSHILENESAQFQQHFPNNSKPLPSVVYVVTDTCYPSANNFDTNIGTTSIISVHSSKATANARAKKIIYENDGGCTVDIDKIIEEVKRGLYTGIGVGGREERDGCCYARKCEVEAKIIDEDSEDEGSGGSVEFGVGEEGGSRGRQGRKARGEREGDDIEMG